MRCGQDVKSTIVQGILKEFLKRNGDGIVSFLFEELPGLSQHEVESL